MPRCGERSRQGQWCVGSQGYTYACLAIFENLEAGANIDEIMEWFHGLDKAQVQEVIEFAARSLDKPPSYAP